jgi:hypothetical protein
MEGARFIDHALGALERCSSWRRAAIADTVRRPPADVHDTAEHGRELSGGMLETRSRKT